MHAEAQRQKQQFIQEDARIAFLSSEVMALRKSLGEFHGGKGWQTEVFLANTGIHSLYYVNPLLADIYCIDSGSSTGSMDVALVDHSLRPWCPLDVDLSMKKIELVVGQKQTLNLLEFIRVCDSLC